MIDQPATAPPSDNLAAGDAKARAGAWAAAIDQWELAAQRDAGDREAVSRRLAWLVEQSEPRPNPLLSREARLVAVATGAALLGAALVILTGEPGSTLANILAAVAWILFIASGTLVVIAARGRQRDTFDDLLRRARATTARRAGAQHKDVS